MLQSIQQAVKIHDNYQIEIKLDYELSESKKTRYRISTYLFLPQSLGIDKYSYSKTDFYRDIQSYIRLKTPPLILRDFVDNSNSPICKIEAITRTENWTTDPKRKGQVIDNLKFLSAMLKSATREHFGLIEKRIAEAAPHSNIPALIHNLVEEFISAGQKIVERYRALYPVFNLPNIDQELYTSYKLTDESISLLIEESAVEMFQVVERYMAKKSVKSTFKESLRDWIHSETKYRKSVGYGSVLVAGEDNEIYAFRKSALKKYAATVLYLSTAMKPEGTGLEHFLFAIAAGVSMVFATVVAFYFQREYGNFTFPFFMALVVGYMFKDRIKEYGRAIFSKYLETILYDRRIIIRTQDGQHKLGVLREKVLYIDEKDMPRGIVKARNRDLITELDNDRQGEIVMRHTKEITLFNKAFHNVFISTFGVTGINDITRYDVRNYLRKMADPIQERAYVGDEGITTVPIHRVYHVNLVSRYRSIWPHKDKLYKRLRLILNRTGIKRIEQVPL
ncbi:MAG: hypothetical protein R3264_16565 [Anaerolineae bacterium]|nr:hypothetical protein [Anaerolineae bacterium]